VIAKKHSKFAPLVIALLGVAAMLPALMQGIPLGADLDNHFRFAQPFYDEIANGNVIPGWLAESNNGFGDTRFRFYPPLLYYILAAARFVTGDWYATTLAVFTLLSVIGCTGIYIWARQNFDEKTSLIAAAVFAVLPYHIAQFYQASLLAEYAAMSFLPFAFLFLERLSKKAAIINIAGLGITFGAIVLTHIPTTIVGSLGLGLFALLLTDWRRNKRFLIYASLGIAAGLALSSFFWIKVVTELSWIQAGHKVTSEHYDYRNNFLFSPWSLTNLNTWLGSVIAAVTIFIFLPALSLFPRLFGGTGKGGDLVERDRTKKPLMASMIVAAFAFFMTTDLSRPLWLAIPKLPDIQFPYRWLTVASVAVCPGAAFAIVWFGKKIVAKQIRAWQLALVAISFAAAGYSIWEFAMASDFLDRETFTSRIEASRAAPSFPDWLPVGAATIKDVKPMSGPIDAGTREILQAEVTTHIRRFKLAPGAATDVRIRTYYYPHWRATVTTPSGVSPAPIKKAPDGTLLVSVPAESCELSVDFSNR
jgi:4-amino-4-deoxy-L-arabinose transferase-like glycosyltransferase